MSDINPEASDGLKSSTSQDNDPTLSSSSSTSLVANSEPWSVHAGEHSYCIRLCF